MTYQNNAKTRLVAATASAALAMLTVLAATDVAEGRPHHHTIDVRQFAEKAQVAESGCRAVKAEVDRRRPGHHSAPKAKICNEGGPALASAWEARG